jgi:hypothetical protein
VVSFRSLPLYPKEKGYQYAPDRRLAGHHSETGWYGKKTFLAAAENENQVPQSSL